MQQMVTCRCEHMWYVDLFKYVAFSDLFPLVERRISTPTYDIQVKLDEMANINDIRVVPVSGIHGPHYDLPAEFEPRLTQVGCDCWYDWRSLRSGY